MRGIIMWVIHDLQGYGVAAHCQVGGYHACPICGEKLRGRFSKALNKCVFPDHRCYLDLDHPFREESQLLNYEKEVRLIPTSRSGEEWLNDSTSNNPIIKKKSIFFRLEYWKLLLI
jgi:hypothetical protein